MRFLGADRAHPVACDAKAQNKVRVKHSRPADAFPLCECRSFVGGLLISFHIRCTHFFTPGMKER